MVKSRLDSLPEGFTRFLVYDVVLFYWVIIPTLLEDLFELDSVSTSKYILVISTFIRVGQYPFNGSSGRPIIRSVLAPSCIARIKVSGTGFVHYVISIRYLLLGVV